MYNFWCLFSLTSGDFDYVQKTIKSRRGHVLTTEELNSGLRLAAFSGKWIMNSCFNLKSKIYWKIKEKSLIWFRQRANCRSIGQKWSWCKQ